MISKAQNALYWRLWGAACRRHGWKSSDGVLRHEQHVLALGADKSHTKFTNQDFDRIKMWFRLLLDPDDVEATMFFAGPESGTAKRVYYALTHDFHEALVVDVCHDKFGTRNWRQLDARGQLELLMTIKRIEAKTETRRSMAVLRASVASTPHEPSEDDGLPVTATAVESAEEANCPF